MLLGRGIVLARTPPRPGAPALSEGGSIRGPNAITSLGRPAEFAGPALRPAGEPQGAKVPCSAASATSWGPEP